MTLPEVVGELRAYMNEVPEASYRVIIGTDSNHRGVDFVTAIVVHRVGKGGRYFWRRETKTKPFVLRTRIWEEALMSLHVAQALTAELGAENHVVSKPTIHVDIGENGPTRAMIQEVVGMIRGNGFPVYIKPESYAASTVADR
ncbi:ribonuclease H-like YkuK family protein, partial [Candidatus Azambacteria bacterium]|nr:ribonuclease H-like YkuK family protein [Candidatus Azambacteria bacterium]